MDVTISYHTVDGEISSVATEPYTRSIAMLTDALGSVVRTEYPFGGADFRYSAYGKLLKQPVGWNTPYIGWVGTKGYRETNLNHAEQYIRARHYSTTEARWITPGSIGYSNPYAAERTLLRSAGNPCDVSKAMPYPVRYKTITLPSREKCGGWGGTQVWEIQWEIANLPSSGWIVQEIRRPATTMKSCVSGQADCDVNPIHYFEGWWVEYGSINGSWPMTTFWNDYWHDSLSCNCHQGYKTMEGWALFFEVPKECGIPNGDWNWSVSGPCKSNAGGLLCGGQPLGWSSALHSEATYRAVCAVANCCKPCKGSKAPRCNPTETGIFPCSITL